MGKHEQQIHMRVTEDEGQMLREIAEHEGISASDIVRVFIRRRHAELFGAPKPKPRPKPKK